MKKILLLLITLSSLLLSQNNTIVKHTSVENIDMKALNEAVAFTMGNGTKDLYIISDPSCRFCKKLTESMPENIRNYKVKVILYPLPSHKVSKPMINYILLGKDNSEKVHRYKETILHGDISYKETKINQIKLNDYVKKSMSMTIKLGSTGTPSVFIEENGVMENKNPFEIRF